MKKLLATAAAVAAGSLLAVGGIAPAHAAEGTDAAVDITKTGGILGFYGNGKGHIKNEGTTTLPRGTSIIVEFHNLHHHHLDVHATTVTGSWGALATPMGLQKWRVTTTRDLAPGQKVDYRWTAYHYGTWHRVVGHATLDSVGGGLTDVNDKNDHDMDDNNGIGF